MGWFPMNNIPSLPRGSLAFAPLRRGPSFARVLHCIRCYEARTWRNRYEARALLSPVYPLCDSHHRGLHLGPPGCKSIWAAWNSLGSARHSVRLVCCTGVCGHTLCACTFTSSLTAALASTQGPPKMVFQETLPTSIKHHLARFHSDKRSEEMTIILGSGVDFKGWYWPWRCR